MMNLYQMHFIIQNSWSGRRQLALYQTTKTILCIYNVTILSQQDEKYLFLFLPRMTKTKTLCFLMCEKPYKTLNTFELKSSGQTDNSHSELYPHSKLDL